MTSIVPFQVTDLFKLNPINLDRFTENFPATFYLQYLCEWPTLFIKTIEPKGTEWACSGYMMGKVEGRKKENHSHVTAVTVSPTYRRLGLASQLCTQLEELTKSKPYDVYFVDLFVKVTNALAITLYEKLGYSVYRRVVGYYGREEVPIKKFTKKDLNDDIDAFDMRKLMPMDVKRESIRENGRDCYVAPEEVVFH